MDASPVRYLSAAEVTQAMPPVAERLALAERTLTALVADAELLVADAELPPKIGVHPRATGSFAHAMPAFLRDPGGTDLLGIKWVTGFPDNKSKDLPAISAAVILNDATTGRPRAILDGRPITAERTAAVSGVALSRFGPGELGRPPRVAVIGAGVQGHSHLEVLGHVLPGVELVVFDRHAERASELAAAARATIGIAAADTTATARDATSAADIVITAASFTDPERRQSMTREWLAADALVIPVDYATMCSAEVARHAALFLVDERGQFVANREAGQFHDYPDPHATLGEAILARTARPTSGQVVVTHLGVGLADVIFADAILRRAEAAGLGTLLGG